MGPDAKDVVRESIAALNRHDWHRAGRLMTPDSNYTIQSYDLPGAATPTDGATHGRAGDGLDAGCGWTCPAEWTRARENPQQRCADI
ncbi:MULTISPECIES: hypothetical protein [Streptomyces]|uniref:SnoaL-like domain-containing protein n=1 Tax=Streptomyces caniscabiei TaxID=2746961 RepID=A0ABU4MXZ6_9ACTN|nr:MULTISPECIES: hypothetical protein [Streptomyces]MBE4741299.1 hypothetical protein [Streptomyces caniscabiei]MBE4760950.1 hypothetical protein [Streptomyces caniscabiei]MBE4774893.1 hypothetical protein [Streptomyces caniscabiei]MBE4789651.1 hypothetical protein [Streptomyces caniscabiei]MBE4798834.1 hypothetical protein [Streptomyces caniscabiei]